MDRIDQDRTGTPLLGLCNVAEIPRPRSEESARETGAGPVLDRERSKTTV